MPQIQIEPLNPEWLSRDPEMVKSKTISTKAIIKRKSKHLLGLSSVGNRYKNFED